MPRKPPKYQQRDPRKERGTSQSDRNSHPAKTIAVSLYGEIRNPEVGCFRAVDSWDGSTRGEYARVNAYGGDSHLR